MIKHLSMQSFFNIFMIMMFILTMTDRYTGSRSHEYLGIILIVIFLIHLQLNMHWMKSIFRGHYNFLRFIRLIIILLLLSSVIGTVGSGIIISNIMFSFIKLQGSLTSRMLHIFFAHWSFILAGVHLGVCWKNMSINHNQTIFISSKIFSILIWIVLPAYGIYAFLHRELMYPLTMSSAFMVWNENDSILFFLLDYAAIFLMVARISYILYHLKNKKEYANLILSES